MNKKLIFAALLLMGAGVWTVGCNRGETPGADSAAVKPKYHCPMHPTYVSDKKGDCPICGMRLVPIESTPAASASTTTVAGYAAIHIPAQRQQSIGVTLGTVERRPLAKIVRAPGRVAYDPELYTAQVEYQEAVKARDRSKEDPQNPYAKQTESLMKSSQLRLKLLGLTEEEIRALESGDDASAGLLLAREGDTAWVYAQIFEYEVGLVKPGQKAEITSTAFPGKSFNGTVRSISPVVDPDSRTFRVRILADNRQNLLRSDMYVDAQISAPFGNVLAVPESAVMNTGERAIVFVTDGELFEPREVRLGQKAEEYYEVLSGLKPGETVVVSGNFLIDSESRLKAALAGNMQNAATAAHQH
jgi:membrane fusion protein, copper/silver efflux system